MFRLKKGAAETLVPTATEGANGRFTINRGVHHKKCRLFTFNQLEAKDVDRFCRSEIGKNPTLNPMEVFEAGQREALKLSKNWPKILKILILLLVSFRHGKKCEGNISEEEPTPVLQSAILLVLHRSSLKLSALL